MKDLSKIKSGTCDICGEKFGNYYDGYTLKEAVTKTGLIACSPCMDRHELYA